jgi:hypothetical protein
VSDGSLAFQSSFPESFPTLPQWKAIPDSRRLPLQLVPSLRYRGLKRLQLFAQFGGLGLSKKILVHLDPSRVLIGVSPFAAEWQYVRQAERWTVSTSSKSQSRATAKTAERNFVV